VDSFLKSFSAAQALEWEVFAGENPTFEEKITTQLAYIASFFSNAYLKRKDKKDWQAKDFMPWLFKAEKKEKTEKSSGIIEGFKSLLALKGDDRGKAWATKDQKEREKVKGTDGKMYTYALEQFANNKKIPNRMRRK